MHMYSEYKRNVCIVGVQKEGRCTNRESNPGQTLGRRLCYHYTIGAISWLDTSFIEVDIFIVCITPLVPVPGFILIEMKFTYIYL